MQKRVISHTPIKKLRHITQPYFWHKKYSVCHMNASETAAVIELSTHRIRAKSSIDLGAE